ncbi:MAG: FxsA family protein [Pseudomonadota bacterium]
MRLFLLFLAVPLIEIALFVQIGGAIGLLATLGIVVLTAVVGSIVVRKQGIATLGKFQTAMNGLSDPTAPLVHGAMILFAGALLLTPGFFTDFVGGALLVPPVRGWLFQIIRRNVVVQGAGPINGQSDVIDGEAVDLDRQEDHISGGHTVSGSGWTRH